MKNKHHWSFFLAIVCLMAPLWVSGAELYDPPSVYLTWQRSPETTMTIQWLTKPTRLDNTVEYHAAGETEWAQRECRDPDGAA